VFRRYFKQAEPFNFQRFVPHGATGSLALLTGGERRASTNNAPVIRRVEKSACDERNERFHGNRFTTLSLRGIKEERLGALMRPKDVPGKGYSLHRAVDTGRRHRISAPLRAV